jgi:hypothetical protein
MAAKAGIKLEVSMAGGRLEQFSGRFRAGSGENQETGDRRQELQELQNLKACQDK